MCVCVYVFAEEKNIFCHLSSLKALKWKMTESELKGGFNGSKLLTIFCNIKFDYCLPTYRTESRL